jgi:hypothetical protein
VPRESVVGFDAVIVELSWSPLTHRFDLKLWEIL